MVHRSAPVKGCCGCAAAFRLHVSRAKASEIQRKVVRGREAAPAPAAAINRMPRLYVRDVARGGSCEPKPQSPDHQRNRQQTDSQTALPKRNQLHRCLALWHEERSCKSDLLSHERGVGCETTTRPHWTLGGRSDDQVRRQLFHVHTEHAETCCCCCCSFCLRWLPSPYLALARRNASPRLLATFRDFWWQPTLAPWCTRRPPACTAAESTRKEPRPEERERKTCPCAKPKSILYMPSVCVSP